jgi:hypothetical protein
MDKLMENLKWDDGKIGFELIFKLLKIFLAKREFTLTAMQILDLEIKKKILNTRLSN